MNRRTFLTLGTSGLIGLTSGCTALNLPTDDTDDDNDDNSSSGGSTASVDFDPDVTIETTDAFDDRASYEDFTVEATLVDEEDAHFVETSFLIHAEDNNCSDLSASFTFYNEAGAVIDEYEVRDGYDPGETYQIDQILPVEIADIDHVAVQFHNNGERPQCFF